MPPLPHDRVREGKAKSPRGDANINHCLPTILPESEASAKVQSERLKFANTNASLTASFGKYPKWLIRTKTFWESHGLEAKLGEKSNQKSKPNMSDLM